MKSIIVYRYIGPGYLMGVPARDLSEDDLREVQGREGITREEIEGSGLYRAVKRRKKEVGDGRTESVSQDSGE